MTISQAACIEVYKSQLPSKSTSVFVTRALLRRERTVNLLSLEGGREGGKGREGRGEEGRGAEGREGRDDYYTYYSDGIIYSVYRPTMKNYIYITGLDIGLVGPVARGASRFKNLLAPQKTYWPGGPVDLKTYWPPKNLLAPQKTNWSLPQNQTCATKNYLHKTTICI